MSARPWLWAGGCVQAQQQRPQGRRVSLPDVRQQQQAAARARHTRSLAVAEMDGCQDAME